MRWKLLGKCGNDFRYTQEGDTVTRTVEGVNDSDKFSRTVQVLDLLGVTKEEQEDLFCLISGILFLGQVKFLQSFQVFIY
jgi:myosin-5